MIRRWQVFALTVVGTLVIPLTACGAVYLPPVPGQTAASSGGATPLPTTVPPSAPQPAPRVVTLANEGQTLTMKVGQTFTLQLGGPPPDWSVDVADPSVLAPVPTFSGSPGSQGLYEAKNQGTTTLTATSSYPCQRAHPACMIASRLFRLTVAVQAA